jgi:copper chaperone CopZ
MNALTFKTNINCGACLSKVSPLLEKQEGIQRWQVDLQSEDRILKVETEKLSVPDVQELISKAGFKAEAID